MKTIHCRFCKEIHKMEDRFRYYCPSVFGGWVTIQRKRKVPRIVGYRKCFTHRLDGEWEWSCPVWFTPGIFADAVINGTNRFETEVLAATDMEKTLKLFGVTKRTKNLNIH